MPDVFFSADQHWGHSIIRAHCDRPFASVDEMDEVLIQNWNSIVNFGDIVYFLGDFVWRDAKKALAIRKRLHGNIFFIEGNHDAAAHKIRNEFGWFKPVAMVKVDEQQIFLSHYAHRVWPKSHFGIFHCFAHSHGTLPDDPHSLSVDVGVDAVAQRLADKRPPLETEHEVVYGITKPEDYRPMSFDELKAIMAAKDWKPIDHHGEKDEED